MKKKSIFSKRKEYLSFSLDELNINPDPFRQFSLWIEDCMKAGVEEPGAMCLSTVAPGGQPSARFVLLKGYDERGFVFFTHYNSRKGNEIAKNAGVALTFYWKEMERQVRILGKAGKVTRQESDEYFLSRPFESRISAVISPQSTVIPGRELLEMKMNGFLSRDRETGPGRPMHWGGYRVKPFMFEFWQGREHRLHDRIQYRLVKGKWIIERLAP